MWPIASPALLGETNCAGRVVTAMETRANRLLVIMEAYYTNRDEGRKPPVPLSLRPERLVPVCTSPSYLQVRCVYTASLPLYIISFMLNFALMDSRPIRVVKSTSCSPVSKVRSFFANPK
jgi:hypothetical protein